jgi:hypothetical protein
VGGNAADSFLAPLINSSTFLKGSRIFKREEGALPLSESSGIKLHLAMECSPATNRINDRQLLKAGDTLI